MATLKQPANIVLSGSEASDIIVWLYGNTSVKPNEFSKEDCGFAQAMLMEMLDASFAMGFVEALFRSSVKAPSGPAKVIKSFLKGAGKNLVKYKDKDDLEKMMKEPVIYKSIKDTMARNCKSVWKIREQTGELTY